MIITISGTPGSGKSTIAGILSQKLRAERLYIGGMLRALARERGMMLQDLMQYAVTHPEIDREVDERVAAEARRRHSEGKMVIVEGRTQYYFLTESIKVYVKVNSEEGARRIWQDLQNEVTQEQRNEVRVASFEEMKHSVLQREEEDALRYKQIYGINYRDETQYDLIVDTTNITALQAAERVLAYVECKEKLIKEGLSGLTMMDTIQEHDFVELDYTGKLTEGMVFDTTVERVARENGFSGKGSFGPMMICVGEGQVLAGLDAALVGKELGKEYNVTLPPELAFGKRDIKQLRIVPMNTFREHQMTPYPGLEVDVDGQRGVITSISGGRVIVNFNHPLAGKDVLYTFIVRRKVTDQKEQVMAFVSGTLQVPKDKVNVVVIEGKATIELPFTLPGPITDIFIKKLIALTKVQEVTFTIKEGKKFMN